MSLHRHSLLLFCLAIFGLNGIHEFYVGLTDIEFNDKEKRYELTIKVFTDDLELAVERFSGKDNLKIGTKNENSKVDSLIFAYVFKHVNLGATPAEKMPLNIIGRETELDVTWLYLESNETKPYPALHVTNSMIMEIYDAQTHMVHLKQGGNIETTVLHSRKKTDTLRP